MAAWILVYLLPTFSMAAVMLNNNGDRIVGVSSKGEAAYGRNAQVEAPAEIHPWDDWQVRKSEARDEIKSAQEKGERAIRSRLVNGSVTQFNQLVNGSTPTGWMQLGTPPKYLYVIFDTGSDKLVAKTWDTVKNELASIDQGISGMVMPSLSMYSHTNSSSYVRKYMIDPDTNQSVPAQSEISYGSGTAVTDEGNETVMIGPNALQNFSLSEVTADSLELLHTKKGISGVLGLQHMKNRSLGRSIFSRMRDAGHFHSFGYCRGTGDNGTFLWGDQSTEGTASNVIGQMHWALTLGRIHVNHNVSHSHGVNHSANANHSANHSEPDHIVVSRTDFRRTNLIQKRSRTWPFSDDQGSSQPADSQNGDASDGSSEPSNATDLADETDLGENATTAGPCEGGNNTCVGILDTGSNIIAGPTTFMQMLSTKVGVAEDCSNYDSLPTIDIEFGGQNLTIHPAGYVMKVPMPSWAKDIMGGDGSGGGDGGYGSLKDNRGGKRQRSLEQGTPYGAGSLDEQDARRQRAKSGWPAVFDHLLLDRGIDLRAAMRGFGWSAKNSSASSASNGSASSNSNATTDSSTTPDASALSDFMCMPALVPLDKHTKFGPLFVVGTPLLQTHYARFSWSPQDDSPKIHIKKLTECSTCRSARPTVANSSTSLEEAAVEPVTAPLLRSHGPVPKPAAPIDVRHSRGPMIRHVEDIAFPHWAVMLEENSVL